MDEFHTGYPKLAAMEDLDPSFIMARRFGWLHIRLLLHLQDELTVLEAKLQAFDDFDAEADPLRLVSRRRDDGFDTKRKDLLQTIDGKMAQYGDDSLQATILQSTGSLSSTDELAFRINKLCMMQKPTERNQNSLYNMLVNTGSQTQGESKWVQYRDDLIALAHDNERSRLNVFVEDAICAVSRTAALALFRTKSQRQRTGREHDHINLVSHERLNAVTSIFITVIATALLLAPTAILHEMPAKGLPQIGVIFGFVLLFALCCAVFTCAKKQEIFMATAAYAAVLVVFLGNSNG